MTIPLRIKLRRDRSARSHQKDNKMDARQSQFEGQYFDKTRQLNSLNI